MSNKPLQSYYRLWNWYVTPQGHHPTEAEGKLLEISIQVDRQDIEADVWLVVSLGLESKPEPISSTAACVLRRTEHMVEMGFKPFGPAQEGLLKENRILITFVCSGESLPRRRRDEESILRLLTRICKALDARVPARLDVKHEYALPQ